MSNPTSTNALTGLMVFCALVVTALMVKRELAPQARIPSTARLTTTAVPNRRELEYGGRRIGPLQAPVTVVEFSDFECPACRQFSLHALAPARRRYGDNISVVYRHWPLSYHKFATAAARAAECAAEQGRFVEAHDLLFQQQDSLGLKPVSDMLGTLDMADSAFLGCLDRTQFPMIALDSKLGATLGINGTPTVIINGERMSIPPDSAALDSLIQRILEVKRHDE